MSEAEIIPYIISGYRAVVKERYEYDALKTDPDLPSTFDEERLTIFRNYFLEYLYPPPEKRAELNEVFESLGAYARQPEKIFRLIADSSFLLFKYGRHLPKLLKAGLNALQSFRHGNSFETKLAQEAIRAGLQPPFSAADISGLIAKLDRADIEVFVNSGQALFETFHDRTLVKKIEEIIAVLIRKMEKRGDTYSQKELDAFRLGYEVIRQGNALFGSLSPGEQELIFVFIVKKEREILNQLFDF